jgi:hypothetical protein
MLRLAHRQTLRELIRMTEDLHYTAYASNVEGTEWTVWDHVKDEAVATGITETDARRLAVELEAGR